MENFSNIKILKDISFWTDKELEKFYYTLNTDEEKNIFLDQLISFKLKLDTKFKEINSEIYKINYIKNTIIPIAKIDQSIDVIKYLDELIPNNDELISIENKYHE